MRPPVVFAELDDYVAAYETRRDEDDAVALDGFLPPGDHSLYLPVLRELVRVEMELRWKERRPHPLAHYLARYPQLAEDAGTLQQLAYEDYRLRLLGGEQPTPAEYSSRYGVSTTGWFVARPDTRPEHSMRTRIVDPRAKPGSQDRADFSCDSHPRAGTEDFPAVGDDVCGFVLKGELGRGSFARVFLAEQRELSGRPVALKLSPASFVREAKTLARLQHTHIVPIYSLHRAGRFVAICMPYLGRLTVNDLLRELRREASLPTTGRWVRERLGGESAPTAIRELLDRSTYAEAVLWLVARLAEGLVHAHERGIVHRDLKPANVLLADDGTPMLLDFNLAEEYAGDEAARVAQVGGTLPYMAPEVLATLRGPVTPPEPRQDLYALGLILAELLTGKFPFPRREGGLSEVVPAMIDDRQRPPVIGGCTPSVTAIVQRCLATDPAKRYASAAQLRDDLECQLAHQPLKHTPEPSLAERFAKWRRRHPRLASVTTMAVLTTVLVAGLVGAGVRQERVRRRLEAQQTRRDLADDLKRIPLLLTADGDPGMRNEGLRLCAAYADRYQLAEADWQRRTNVATLPTEERREALESLGELLWLWGRAKPDAGLIDQARACYAPDRVPSVMGAGKKPVTERDHFLALLDQTGSKGWREVLPVLEQLSHRDAGQPMPWVFLSRAYQELGQPEQARVYAEMATSVAPEWPWSWYHLGLTNLANGKFRPAREAFDRVLELSPGLPEGRLNRAIANLQLGDPRAAIVDLDALIEMNAPYTRVYFIRAMARGQVGDGKGAGEDQAEGQKREPGDELSWLARAQSWLPGDPKKALADLDRAIALYPQAVTPLKDKAHVLAEYLSRPKDAVACLDAALKRRPDDVPARAGRGVALARMGMREAAHKDARAVLEASQQAGLVYQAACVYALTAKATAGDAAEALRLLHKAFQLEGRWLEVAERDPDLDPIRQDKAFGELLDRGRKWLRGGSS